MYVEVLKPFPGPGGRPLAKGEVCDATAWTLRDKLIAQRFVRETLPPATPDDDPAGFDVPVSAPRHARRK